MPELPEVETLKKGLEKSILGKKIADVEIRLPKIISLGPRTVSNIRKNSAQTVRTFRKLLIGQKIQAIKRRAKMLVIELSPRFFLPRPGKGERPARHSLRHQALAGGERSKLLIHLKMTGQLIYAKKGEKKIVKIYNAENAPTAELPHKYTHVIFHFADGSKLYFNDLRQFGYLRLVRGDELSQVKELAEFGAEPLSEEFKFEEFLAKAKRRAALTIKQYLMDPKVVAGIGNIYSDEILYCAKLRPHRRLRSLSKQDFQLVFKCIPAILKKAIKAQGSSVGDFFKVDGSEGRFGPKHMVYQRYGSPCKVCGEPIEKIKLGGRTSSYCPHCQR